MSTLAGQLERGVGEGIITPEAVVLELESAGIASRLFSGVIDALVQVTAFCVIMVMLLLVLRESTTQTQNAAALIVAFAIIFGYPLISEMVSRGRTIGKVALGLRVVTVEGAPIRFRHAALRAMGGLVDKWIPPGGLVGLLFVLGTPSRQRIGDLLAGTIVIRDPNR